MVLLMDIVSLLMLNLFYDIADGSYCKNIEPMTDFQPEKSTGLWYGIARIPNCFDKEYKCLQYNITLDIPNALHLNSSGSFINNDTLVDYNIIMEYKDDPSVASFNVYLQGQSTNDTFYEIIADTDYETYQIYYSCDDENKIEYCWIFAKERIISDEFWEDLLIMTKNIGITVEYLVKVDQVNCNN